jgi:hypothetical protein
MQTTMTKQQAKQALGIKTDAELARVAGRTLPAVWQWGDDPIPMTSYVRLHIKHPRLFPMPKEPK